MFLFLVLLIDTRTGRRRSGRPSSTNESLQNGSRDAGAGSNESSSLNIDFCDDASSQKWPSHMSGYSDVPQRSALEPSNDLSWLNPRSMPLTQLLDQFIECEENANHTPPFDHHVPLEQGLDLFADVAMVMPAPDPVPQNLLSTRDSMETDIQELTELNIRAYRLATDVDTPFTDDLCAMTQSALKVLARITATAQQDQSEIAASNSSDRYRRTSMHQNSSASISLVLQAVSVCEQIYGVFIHACATLRSGLERKPEPSNGSDISHHRMSDARAVMTVELINYLFEKLSRAQRQLLATALTAEDGSPSTLESSTTGGSTTSVSPSEPSDLSSDCSASTNVIAIIMSRTCGKHTQLQSSIQNIRDLTRTRDCI